MKSPLFSDTREDFGSTPLCANCQEPMPRVRYNITISGETVKVCGLRCEDEFRAKHNAPRKSIEVKPGKPSRKIQL